MGRESERRAIPSPGVTHQPNTVQLGGNMDNLKGGRHPYLVKIICNDVIYAGKLTFLRLKNCQNRSSQLMRGGDKGVSIEHKCLVRLNLNQVRKHDKEENKTVTRELLTAITKIK